MIKRGSTVTLKHLKTESNMSFHYENDNKEEWNLLYN